MAVEIGQLLAQFCKILDGAVVCWETSRACVSVLRRQLLDDATRCTHRQHGKIFPVQPKKRCSRGLNQIVRRNMQWGRQTWFAVKDVGGGCIHQHHQWIVVKRFLPSSCGFLKWNHALHQLDHIEWEHISDQLSWRQVRQALQYTCSHLWVAACLTQANEEAAELISRGWWQLSCSEIAWAQKTFQVLSCKSCNTQLWCTAASLFVVRISLRCSFRSSFGQLHERPVACNFCHIKRGVLEKIFGYGTSLWKKQLLYLLCFLQGLVQCQYASFTFLQQLINPVLHILHQSCAMNWFLLRSLYSSCSYLDALSGYFDIIIPHQNHLQDFREVPFHGKWYSTMWRAVENQTLPMHRQHFAFKKFGPVVPLCVLEKGR